jgi:hypothetical protein
MAHPVAVSTISDRMKIVHEHVRLENQHDLDGIIGTFGETARYDDEPWDAHYRGLEEVRTFYAQLLQAMPDLGIDIQREYAGEEAVILEVKIRGRHLGRGVDFPLLAASSIFRFAVFSHSTGGTSSSAKKSTMIVRRFSSS